MSATSLAIAADGVHLSFDGTNQVLSDVSLHVRQGEFVSLVGPSGCGKTTLLNLAAGLVPHTGKGSLQVGGQAPRQGNPQVGYMLARDSLMPWKTALGNAMFGMEVRGVPRAQAQERARAMLQEVGLAGFKNALPKALSHGMRQRVALARTFAMGSPLLLMDEPFGALDAQVRRDLRRWLRELHDRTGLTTPDALQADWNFYLAYNMFRLAAILQGIAKRVETGTASSAQAVKSAAGARPMAELAWRFAQTS